MCMRCKMCHCVDTLYVASSQEKHIISPGKKYEITWITLTISNEDMKCRWAEKSACVRMVVLRNEMSFCRIYYYPGKGGVSNNLKTLNFMGKFKQSNFGKLLEHKNLIFFWKSLRTEVKCINHGTLLHNKKSISQETLN